MGNIVSRWTWDMYLRRDGYDVEPHRRRLSQSQYATVEELRARQLARLRDLLTFAYENNPFYRERFDAVALTPGAIDSLEKLEQIPILTKDDVRERLTRSFSSGYEKAGCIRKRTGGSTGVPLHVYVDMAAMSEKKAATERHNLWAGRRIGDPIGMVWGDTTDLPWRIRLRNLLTDRAVFLDTLHFDEETIERFLTSLNERRPPVLLGHAHSLFRLAEYVLAVDRHVPGIRSVISSAMVLSPEERVTIERAFDCEVYDRYGCEELSVIASECEAHAGLHVFAEGLVVEVLGEDTERIPGKLVITDLTNRAMPLIRYEIGDYARTAPETCPCGRTLPRLAEISGRTADFLYRADGTPVFGISILDTFVIHIPGIKQVQIIQDRLDHLELLVVRDAGYSEESRGTLDTRVREIFGEAMKHDVRFVEEVPRTEQGKYRFSICRIPEFRRP